MAWVKIPAEHHPLFLAALPKDRRVSTLQMFGGIAAKTNGYMFGGLFARSAIVRLSPADQRAALMLDGSAPFDPMGNGRVMKDTIALSEAVMDEPAELRDWLARAFAFTATLPPKAKAKPKSAAKPAASRAKPTAAAKPKSGAKSKAGAKPAAAKPKSGAKSKVARAKRAAAKPKPAVVRAKRAAAR